MSNPLISVLIPAYNAEKTIRRALDSVVIQNYSPLEIIVVNDASLDATRNVVASFGHPCLKLFDMPHNTGEGAPLNAGLRIAKGEFIAFLDADDEWLPGKLHKQIEFITAHPGMSFVSCGCLFMSPNGKLKSIFGMDLPAKSDEVWRTLLAATHVAKPCVMARRSKLDEVGEFSEKLAVASDQDMWIRLALVGEVGVVLEPLVKAHDTPNSLTKKYARRAAEFTMPMVTTHLERLRHRLSKREIRTILGERYGSLGRNLYTAGAYMLGISYLLRAILQGNRPAENSWYLVTASPPAMQIKALLRSKFAH
jgi:glycosyltransferase involved in cell wall biosynthesis